MTSGKIILKFNYSGLVGKIQDEFIQEQVLNTPLENTFVMALYTPLVKVEQLERRTGDFVGKRIERHDDESNWCLIVGLNKAPDNKIFLSREYAGLPIFYQLIE